MRPEADLLLCCGRTRQDPGQAARLEKLLQGDPDWPYLLRAAQAHRVTPLLAWHLRAAAPGAVPPPVLDRLDRSFKANARRNLFLTRDLLRVLRLLEADGVPALPLKGPVLAETIYGNLALRQFDDIDVLVHRRDMPRARETLLAGGYRPRSREQDSTSTNETPRRARHEVKLERAGGSVWLELQWSLPAHWRVLTAFPPEPERLWERIEPVPFAGTTVRGFTPEELLLLLCVHGANHGWQRLNWLCDVAELLRLHPQLDFERCLAQARAWGGARMLRLGLALAVDLLDAPLPEPARQRVRADAAVEPLARQVRGWLFAEGDPFPHLFDEATFYVRLRERWRDRAAYALFYAWAYLRPALVPAPEEADRAPSPTFPGLLRYPRHWMRMVCRYGLAPLTRLLRRLPGDFLAR